MFEISPTGYISIKILLDAEDVSLYNLTIVAQDQGTPPLNSTVKQRMNENPLFKCLIYLARCELIADTVYNQ